MTTASQLLDSMARELVRPDFIQTGVLASYLNQTLREMHSHPTSGFPILFDANLIEDTFDVASLPALWTIPRVNRFQRFAVAKNSTIGTVFRNRKPQYIATRDSEPYWYRTGTQIAFSDVNTGVGNEIQIAYYEYPRAFNYVTSASRLVTWNETTDTFEYDVSLTTPEQRAAALDGVSSWMLWSWMEVVKQGIRSKVWARLGETERARTSYSSYQSSRLEMLAQESYELDEMR